MKIKRCDQNGTSVEYNPFVYGAVGPSTTCLDVGCSDGLLGSVLIEQKNCVVDGLDFRPTALDMARKQGYRQTYCIDLNKNVFDTNNRYDIVVCADVLEHLIHPLDTLKSLQHLLNDNGIMVISIPNIAFVQYRILHLIGKFDYCEEGGVMDATHLRFYTAKTIRSFCKDAGLQVIKLRGYNLVKKRYCFLKLLGLLWPKMFCLQFLVLAQKTTQPEK
jgi:2-polyprenyl-3-methyl-5-hydroxy-6-metoxy-1,4-benzoquinol methylase